MSKSVLEDRRDLTFGHVLAARGGWYHSMEFPDGTQVEGYIPLEVLKQRYVDFGLPDDLTGKRVIDIGAWDGWFSFELERHGADVTAVDLVAMTNFQMAYERVKSRVKYVISDVYNLPRHNIGKFDYTLFLGVLYHVRHPLLALDIVCGLTREMAIVDSLVIDTNPHEQKPSALPFCEFYETTELGGNLDNWFGPSVDCLLAFCRDSGFVRVRLINVWERHARVACYRHWEPVPEEPAASAPVLLDAKHSYNYGVLFSSDKEEYLNCWFRCDAESLTKTQVMPEVGEFAAPVLVLKREEAGVFIATFRIPPGLAPGAHAVRLRLDDSGYSNERMIYLDTPVRAGQFSILKIFDGVHWTENKVSLADGGYLTIWITGLPAEADLISTELYAGNERIPLTYVGEELPDGARQLNAQLITVLPACCYGLYVRHGSGVSDIVQIEVE